MSKFKIFLVLLGIISMPAAFGYSNGVTMKNNDGGTTIVINRAGHGGSDKSNSINAYIDGHILSVAFSDNIGQVSTEITNENGATVECLTFPTPTGYQFYVPLAGRYTVTFTLSSGDEYYGYFEVEE